MKENSIHKDTGVAQPVTVRQKLHSVHVILAGFPANHASYPFEKLRTEVPNQVVM